MNLVNGIIRIVYYSIDEGEEGRVWYKGSGFGVQGSGFGVSSSGVVPFDYVRKRFSGFNRFKRFNGGGAALKNMEAPRRFETSGFLVSQT